MKTKHLGRAQTFTLDGLPALSTRGPALREKRFDGVQKSKQSWDSLRRVGDGDQFAGLGWCANVFDQDNELWLHRGNCLVHLCAPGTSRRGPSLKIPLHLLEQSNCPYLFDERMGRSDPPAAISECDDSDSGYGASIDERAPRLCDIYIPAPPQLTRRGAYLYHIGTRNYFAYLLNKPIVGEHLGAALSNLATRLEKWQPEAVASTGFLDYCQNQGYLDFAENIEYAVAGLLLAEEARIPCLWADAFAHCVGMEQRLDEAGEATRLSRTTETLINCASFGMEMHISKAATAIGTFLEEELGSEYLGLSKPLRDHLDRFRSVLHSFYINEAGYFPPDKKNPWDKRLWNRMYEDFRSLYEYLADMESSTDLASNRGVNGGICVIQNLHAFNERHGYSPLLHPLPLEPESSSHKRNVELPTRLRSIKFVKSAAAVPPKMTQTLSQASNTDNPGVLGNRLVQEYATFERSRLEEKVSPVEARKVRWLLIYGVLQTLISIIRAPAEVHDTVTPSYPLCLTEAARPAWMSLEMDHQCKTDSRPRLSVEMDAVRRVMEEDRLSIHPDCEADSAEDFFSMNSFAPKASEGNNSAEELPLRAAGPLLRAASLRSSVSSLHHSIVGSFSRRSSYSVRRGSSFRLSSKQTTFYEDARRQDEAVPEVTENKMEDDMLDLTHIIGSSNRPASLDAPEGQTWVPTLELHQLNASPPSQTARRAGSPPKAPRSALDFGGQPLVHPLELARPPIYEHLESSPFDPTESPSTQSGVSSQGRRSNTSSYFDEPHSPNSNISVPTIYSEPVDVEPTESDSDPKTTKSHRGLRLPLRQTSTTALGTSSRGRSAESVSSVSSASSYYPEGDQQAAEIEVDEPRGRRRLRGLRASRALALLERKISLPSTPYESFEGQA